MKIKTEKYSTTILRFKVHLPENVTFDDAREILKNKGISAYHGSTRKPMWVSITYDGSRELEKAKSFAKAIGELSEKRMEK
jgi:hypothetical protein